MSRIRNTLFAVCSALTLVGSGAALNLAVDQPAYAQMGGHGGAGGPGGPGGGPSGSDDDAKRKKREQEFGALIAPLPKVHNAGPCPFVKVLYDAARFVEFKDNHEAFTNVGYTGEIENIASGCAYKNDEPITVGARVLFELGRGPTATGRQKTYKYWVAVTDRNHAVLQKAWFELPVTFPAGQDRVTVTDTVDKIVIPRRDAKVSGANFEVLVGFDVTPQMAEFNRQGKRFRPDAGETAQVAAAKQ
ncbi:MAG: Tat pathway signal sequence domain protein [Caulobacteraceae bacterium]|nr:Tat pathway signal sequence domain protein [Caulobacteraceae bacterium]